MKTVLAISTFVLSATAFGASKGQISQVLNATSLTDISTISADSTQPRCFGCVIMTVKGQGPYGEAWQHIQVQQIGPNQFSSQILSQSR